jgi:PAS domain S-box-containing protein
LPLALRAFLVLLLALLPALWVQLYFEGETRAARGREATEEAMRLAALVNAEQLRIVQGTSDALGALAAEPSVRAADAGCGDTLARLAASFPRYTFIQRVSAEGLPLCGQGSAMVDPGFLRAALAGGEPAVGPISARGGGPPALPFVRPLGPGRGGALAAGLSLDWLEDTLARLPLPPDGVALVADADGRLLAAAPQGSWEAGQELPPGLRFLLAQPAPGVTTLALPDGIPRRVALVPPAVEPRGLAILVGINAAGLAEEEVAAGRQSALLMVGSVLLGILLVMAAFHRGVNRPVLALLTGARDWAAGRWERRLGRVGGGQEFARLAEGLDAMAEAVSRQREAQRGEDERLRALLEVSPQIAFLADAAGRVTWCNQLWTELTGRTAEAAAGHAWTDALHPYDRAEAARRWHAAAPSGAPFEAQARLALPDGGSRWFLFRAVRDGAGWIGVGLDIEGLRGAREDAAASAARLAATYATAPVGLLIVSREGRCPAANDAAPAARGQRLETAAPEFAAAAGAALREALAGRAVREAELRFAEPGGERVLLGHFEPVRAPSGEVTAASAALLDITDRRRDEERERVLAREVDHRARNLLAVVRSLVRLSLRGGGRDVATIVASLEGRIAALTRAHTLLSRERWQGADLGNVASGELGAVAGARRYAIAGPRVRLRPEAVQPVAVVLHELATNALRHGALSRPGGTLRLTWSAPAPDLVLEWEEEGGPAIEAEPPRGLGLDLVVATAPAQLEGEAALDWQPGGLRCRLRVGAALLRPVWGQSLEEAGPPELPPRSPILEGKRVLFAEDEPLPALELAATLRALGCVAIGPARTPEEVAGWAAGPGAISAAVLDIDLRGRAVLPAAAALRGRGVPLVFLSASAAVPAGFEDAPLVAKPLHPDALAAALEQLLG